MSLMELGVGAAAEGVSVEWLQYGELGVLAMFLVLVLTLGRSLLEKLQAMLDRNQSFMERVVGDSLKSLHEQGEAWRDMAERTTRAQEQSVQCIQKVAETLERDNNERRREHDAQMDLIKQAVVARQQSAAKSDKVP